MAPPSQKTSSEQTVRRARTVLSGSEQERSWGNQQAQPADEAYESLAREVIQNGEILWPEYERTGTGTLQKFGLSYVVDVSPHRFPVITTKKVFFSSVVAELLWFLSGSSNISELQEHTGIWNEWADDNGDLETAYGRYWRDYPQIGPGDLRMSEAKHETPHSHYRRHEKGVDQIAEVVQNIKDNPHSRRNVVVAWHPDNAWSSRLPPCHFAFVFHVTTAGKLCLEVHQRSGDIALGVPFNMASYALLLHIVADECGLKTGLMKHNITNAHVYLNHAEDLAHQLQRTSRGGPGIGLDFLGLPEETLMDMDLGNWGQYVDDYSLNNYNPHPPVKYEVAV
ncbi:thymidylate synthase [Salinibacter ruber]|uniref:Thymidylate synthase n=1 Tax=Salinibacter ruber TaxID=146919 RepID=A0A9X2QED7_9BACT|nr:thymidylate synthase [Salinibacter ruber]MCS3661829.1 thymidylate synthase [Salinibacter ruber]MCS3711622.1 thymidylate synthase [Salinibacter ruber]